MTTIRARIPFSELPSMRDPLPHHDMGLSYTASGYGDRIPTVYKVQLPGSTRWRRVYCCIHSNAGTLYVEHRGKLPTDRIEWTVITD